MSTRKLQPHEMLNHSHDIQLCDLVSRNPCLYDPSLPEYKEAAVRERAWEDIAADINVPIDICKSRWRNIRDCYRRNKKWRMFGYKGDFSAKPRKVYVLNEHLEFLDSVDDEKRSIALLQQQDMLDGQNMVPNIEIILDVAKSEDEFGREFKQEREEEEDEGEEEEEDNLLIEKLENQNVFDASDAFTSTNVTSTCNLGTMQTCAMKTNSVRVDEFTSGRTRKRKAAISKVMLRKLYKKVPTKAKNRCEQKKKMPQSKIQEKIERECLAAVSYDEDATYLFFRSLAITSKTFHPVILAELKKKICATVMDAVLENEKLSDLGLYSNVYHSSTSASNQTLSSPNSSLLPLQNKQGDDSEVTT